MSYQSDIVDAILADPQLSEMIGGRVYASVADSAQSPPYLVYRVITTAGETPFDGKREVIFPLIRFTVWANKAQAIAIISRLRHVIEGRNLPGSSDCSLGYESENSTYDSHTKLHGEVVEFRASCKPN